MFCITLLILCQISTYLISLNSSAGKLLFVETQTNHQLSQCSLLRKSNLGPTTAALQVQLTSKHKFICYKTCCCSAILSLDGCDDTLYTLTYLDLYNGLDVRMSGPEVEDDALILRDSGSSVDVTGENELSLVSLSTVALEVTFLSIDLENGNGVCKEKNIFGYMSQLRTCQTLPLDKSSMNSILFC